MKKLLTFFLSLMLLVGMLAVPVFAATKEIKTQEELIDAMMQGGSIALAADIEMTDGYCDIMEDMVLDLNGHTLSVAEGSHSFMILFRYEKSLVIRDSVGGGAIKDEEGSIGLSQQAGKVTVESGYLQEINVSSGELILPGGTVDRVSFDGFQAPVTVKSTGAEIAQWHCGRGTIDFDPSPYIRIGYAVTDNGDGTYTIDTVTVEKTGKTISVFYHAYDEERGVYHLSIDGQMPDALNVEILFVNDGESEVIPMTKCDTEGKLWEAQVDEAYIGAEMCIANDADGISTMILTVPDKNGMTYLVGSNQWVSPTEEDEPVSELPAEEDEPVSELPAEEDEPVSELPAEDPVPDEIPKEPSGQTPDFWIWLIPVAVLAVIVAVAVVILCRKKKVQ